MRKQSPAESEIDRADQSLVSLLGLGGQLLEERLGGRSSNKPLQRRFRTGGFIFFVGWLAALVAYTVSARLMSRSLPSANLVPAPYCCGELVVFNFLFFRRPGDLLRNEVRL